MERAAESKRERTLSLSSTISRTSVESKAGGSSSMSCSAMVSRWGWNPPFRPDPPLGLGRGLRAVTPTKAILLDMQRVRSQASDQARLGSLWARHHGAATMAPALGSHGRVAQQLGPCQFSFTVSDAAWSVACMHAQRMVNAWNGLVGRVAHSCFAPSRSATHCFRAARCRRLRRTRGRSAFITASASAAPLATPSAASQQGDSRCSAGRGGSHSPWHADPPHSQQPGP